MIFLVGVTAAATALMALFNWQLVGVTHDLKQATIDAAAASKESAKAARDSADAAKFALQGDRPFVLLESLELKSGLPGSEVAVTFHLKNLGKSPALLRELRAKLGITEFPNDLPSWTNPKTGERSINPADAPEFPKEINYTDARLEIAEEVLGVGAVSSVYRITLNPGIGETTVRRLKTDYTVSLGIQGGGRLSGCRPALV
jgi:hypothetical protein